MDDKKRANLLSNRIIGAAIEVHKALGLGLLESTYEACICHELNLQGIQFQRQVPLPVKYKGLELEIGYCYSTLTSLFSGMGSNVLCLAD